VIWGWAEDIRRRTKTKPSTSLPDGTEPLKLSCKLLNTLKPLIFGVQDASLPNFLEELLYSQVNFIRIIYLSFKPKIHGIKIIKWKQLNHNIPGRRVVHFYAEYFLLIFLKAEKSFFPILNIIKKNNIIYFNFQS
jgi:hypothetical protein